MLYRGPGGQAVALEVENRWADRFAALGVRGSARRSKRSLATVALLAVALFGLLPAWRAARAPLAASALLAV